MDQQIAYEIDRAARRAFCKPGPLTPEQWAEMQAKARATRALAWAIQDAQTTNLTEDSRWVIRALAEESYKRNPTDLATLRMAGLSDSAVAALVGRLQAL